MKSREKEVSDESLKITFHEGSQEEGLRILAHMISRVYLKDQLRIHKGARETDKEGELS